MVQVPPRFSGSFKGNDRCHFLTINNTPQAKECQNDEPATGSNTHSPPPIPGSFTWGITPRGHKPTAFSQHLEEFIHPSWCRTDSPGLRTRLSPIPRMGQKPAAGSLKQGQGYKSGPVERSQPAFRGSSCTAGSLDVSNATC